MIFQYTDNLLSKKFLYYISKKVYVLSDDWILEDSYLKQLLLNRFKSDSARDNYRKILRNQAIECLPLFLVIISQDAQIKPLL